MRVIPEIEASVGVSLAKIVADVGYPTSQAWRAHCATVVSSIPAENLLPVELFPILGIWAFCHRRSRRNLRTDTKCA
jgi:hypothetical protein